MKNIIYVLCLLLLGINMTNADLDQKNTVDQENTVIMKLEYGDVVLKLRPDLAPNHVERIKKLTTQGFYNGLKFHRVIDGFMAQTGDPRGDGTGGSELPNVKAEFSKEPFKRGVLGMARSNNYDSANSQFFIMFKDGDFLNGQYTVFGEVTSGMEFVDNIAKGEPPIKPDEIISMKIQEKINLINQE